MNSPNPFTHDVWQRIERLVNGDANDEDVSAVEAALRGNPAAQDAFLEYCQLHLDLSVEIRADVAAGGVLQQVANDRAQEEAAVAKRARASRFRGLPFSMSLSAILLIGGCLLTIGGGICGWRLRGQALPPALEVAAARSQIAPVAYLVSANGCEWGSKSSQAPLIGSSLGSGDQITLNEGIAEFRLENGVLLSIEGPAAVVLSSPWSMRLDYGKLTANVRWTPTDFQVHAGQLCVTASDAEFGIYREDGKAEVHAFAGEVRTQVLPAGRAGGKEVAGADAAALDENSATLQNDVFTSATVPAGNALWLMDDGGVWKVNGTGRSAEPERFAIRLPMAGRLPISSDYVGAVLASKPIGYWRFAANDSVSIPNEIAGGIPLNVMGKLRTTEDTGNSALEFQPSSNCYLATEPLDHLVGKEFSVEFWVKPSHVHWGGVLALVSSEPAEDQAFYLELLGPRNLLNNTVAGKKYPNTIHILHRDPPNGSRSSGTSCFSQSLYRHRRWQHVVATKSKDELRLYVDGELSAQARDTDNLAKGLRLVVGRLGTMSYSRKFVGQLDEVAIYGRALSDDEIRSHYQAVEWTPEQEASRRHDGI